jgi:thiamine-phosphate pyrophosphorylase
MSKPFAEQIVNISESGVDMIILREKDLIEPEYRYLAIECQAICTEYGVPLCINSYVNTAKAMNIENVQLPLGTMRRLTDRDGLTSIGVSVHSVKEAKEATELGADYLIAGPIFQTECKPDTVPKGPELIKDICKKVNVPVYAIGGITSYNIKHIASNGGSGVCIRSSAMRTDNAKILVRELKTNFDEGLKHLEIAGNLV